MDSRWREGRYTVAWFGSWHLNAVAGREPIEEGHEAVEQGRDPAAVEGVAERGEAHHLAGVCVCVCVCVCVRIRVRV